MKSIVKKLLPFALFLLFASLLQIKPKLFFYTFIVFFITIFCMLIIASPRLSKQYIQLEKQLQATKMSELKPDLVKIQGKLYCDNPIISHIKDRPTIYSHYIAYTMKPSRHSGNFSKLVIEQIALDSKRYTETIYILIPSLLILIIAET